LHRIGTKAIAAQLQQVAALRAFIVAKIARQRVAALTIAALQLHISVGNSSTSMAIPTENHNLIQANAVRDWHIYADWCSIVTFAARLSLLAIEDRSCVQPHIL
jgi:hypothetical protein